MKNLREYDILIKISFDENLSRQIIFDKLPDKTHFDNSLLIYSAQESPLMT